MPLDVDDAIAAVYDVVIAVSRVSVYAFASTSVFAIAVTLLLIAVSLFVMAVALFVIAVALFKIAVALFDIAVVLLLTDVAKSDKSTPLASLISTFFNVTVLPSCVNTSTPLICNLSKLLFVNNVALGSASCNTVLFPILKAIYISLRCSKLRRY